MTCEHVIGRLYRWARRWDGLGGPICRPEPSRGPSHPDNRCRAEWQAELRRGRKPGLPPEYRKVFGGAWNWPVFVLTLHAPDDEEDATITFLSGDIRSAVATGLRAAEGKNLLIIGASLAHQCIEAGLIDEILVHVAPILLGDGVRFFARKAGEQVELETIAVSQAGQIINLRFRVRKASTEA